MNDRVPTISIALATFNGARFIGQQLESLATQTRLPDELVVCDDRSEDATVSIVEAFSEDGAVPGVRSRSTRRDWVSSSTS